MRHIILLIALLCTLFTLPAAAQVGGEDLLGTLVSANKRVIALDSVTFEHDTQASTGMTTGDWFVLFYADMCGHCHHVKPEMEALAKRYDEHQTSVAAVDGEASGDLLRRFKIRSYPTLILFRKKKLYRFTSGAGRTADAFVKFLADPEAAGAVAEEIPAPLSYADEFLYLFNSVEMNDFYMIYEQNPMLALFAVGTIVVSNGILIGACLMPIFRKKQQPKKKVTAERKQK